MILPTTVTRFLTLCLFAMLSGQVQAKKESYFSKFLRGSSINFDKSNQVHAEGRRIKTVPPSRSPTARPTLTARPNTLSTAVPSAPTQSPTARPTTTPTELPTAQPVAPSAEPTFAPSAPTNPPTAAPSLTPTQRPSARPTAVLTAKPSASPTMPLTKAPTRLPTTAPSSAPGTNAFYFKCLKAKTCQGTVTLSSADLMLAKSACSNMLSTCTGGLCSARQTTTPSCSNVDWQYRCMDASNSCVGTVSVTSGYGAPWDGIVNCAATYANCAGNVCSVAEVPITETTCSNPAVTPNYQGFYYVTWLSTFKNPSPLTAGVAFSGETVVSGVYSALTASNQVYDRLPGRKVLSFGGYNSANDRGYWTALKLQDITTAINTNAISTDKYGAIMYDIEYGDSGLLNSFLASFAAAKAKGFQVIVCISGPAPFAFADKNTLMQGILQSSAVDYVSPMLYASGYETTNDYGGDYVSAGFAVSGGIKPKVVVSITGNALRNNGYADAQRWFLNNYKITTFGYIVWEV